MLVGNCKDCTIGEKCLCITCENKCKNIFNFEKFYDGKYGCFNECKDYIDWLTKLTRKKNE